jgi:hypothetical protein
MSERFPVYVFRDGHFAPARDTFVSAAPLDLVVSVYGGGGIKGEGGLAAVFGGAAVFKNEESGLYYLGVWGARNASRFRTALRASGVILDIVREPPPARLIFFETRGRRPSLAIIPQAESVGR